MIPTIKEKKKSSRDVVNIHRGSLRQSENVYNTYVRKELNLEYIKNFKQKTTAT